MNSVMFNLFLCPAEYAAHEKFYKVERNKIEYKKPKRAGIEDSNP